MFADQTKLQCEELITCHECGAKTLPSDKHKYEHCPECGKCPVWEGYGGYRGCENGHTW